MTEPSIEDRTRVVRSGEELDEATLRPYLASVLGGPVQELTIRQFPGGHSNLTYLLDVDGRELVLRRPPIGSKVKRAHDMGREFGILSKLSTCRDWAPKPLAFCDDHDVIGADFYLMNRISGVIVRRDPPQRAPIDTATARRMCELLIDLQAELHALNPEQVGLADFGKPDGYVERQVRGWIKRYGDAKTDDIPEMRTVAAWLLAHMPPSLPGVIIHNDFKFDNVVFRDERYEAITGVLDWEMATLGDPLMDLGTTLCYWIQADDHPGLQNLKMVPTNIDGMYTRQQLAERYAEKTGRDVSNIVFYYIFGLYKTAAVLQQIYLRYKKGLTEDARFAGLIMGVKLLAQRAAETVGSQEL